MLILSARCEVADKVAGARCGQQNDYLTSPFTSMELAARIRSLTLRRFTQSDVVLTCAELSFDTKARKASVRGEVLSLTRKETGILEYLLLHQGRPVSQEELLEHVWDSGADGFGNSIRVHISALRKKLRAALGYDPIPQPHRRGLCYGGADMKRLSLQWRITLMTAALIGVTCVLMNCLIGYSGKRYMDAIGSGISAYSEIESGAPGRLRPAEQTAG